MKHGRLDEMVKGWFVGDFEPTLFRTKACEVGVKRYRAGDCEAAHVHRVAGEITLILDGRVRMLGKEWTEGDIVLLDPGEPTAFEALTDAVCVVVKIPSVIGDKYLAE